MPDMLLRKIVDRPFVPIAAHLARHSVSPILLMEGGFAVGLAAIFCVAAERPLPGLGLLAANRILRGLDGPLTQLTGASVPAGYLDAVFESILYSGLAFAFALADPGRALAASFFILSLASSKTSDIARPDRNSVDGQTDRMVEGIALFLGVALSCIEPVWFSLIAYLLGIACFVLTGLRIAAVVSQR